MLQQEAIWHNVCWQTYIFTMHETVFFRFCSVATSLHLYLYVELPVQYISQYVHPMKTIALAEYQIGDDAHIQIWFPITKYHFFPHTDLCIPIQPLSTSKNG